MLSSKVRTGENLINFFYISFLPIFDFLYSFLLLFSLLFIILLDILSVNNLLFKDILTQLNTFKTNNISFILTLIIYTYL